MSKTLVICEKPSVAADVAKALSGSRTFAKQDWGYASADMLVAAAAGHLVAELPPERYDETYKEWRFDLLPILPERFMYQPRDQRAAGRLRQIADLIRRDDVTELVNACDAGREGELIFKLIVQFARANKPIRRAWFSSMTPAAITEAFANLRADSDMAGLEAAARCRSEADWYVGMNATRAATCTLGGGRQTLSVGRVQTPTLALIVGRDLEIENFVPTEYFRVTATFGGGSGDYSGQWRSNRDSDAKDRFDDRADAEQVAARVSAAGSGVVVDVTVTAQTVRPPKLYDLTDLQRDANRRYGLTAAKTLEAAQACYETHKVLSYPRTDSRYLPSDMASAVPSILNRVAAADPTLAPLVAAAIADGPPSDRIIDDNKISDHHGLVPTDATHDLSKLDQNERRIYDLVARRFVASMLPAQELERTVIWTDVSGDMFRTSGTRILVNGWKDALPDPEAKAADKDDDAEAEAATLPEVAQGEQRPVDDVKVSGHWTKPPARHNESSLLGAMASAGQLVTDDDAADAMKDSGLGTPATRASIIERLVKVEYAERSGKHLIATAKGRGLILALGDHPLVAPDLTGAWEKRLRELERITGAAAQPVRDQFSVDVRAFTRDIVAGFEGRTPDQLAAGRRKIAPCPVPGCSGTVVEGRAAWGCDTYKSADDAGCGFIVWKKSREGRKVTDAQLRKQIEAVRSGEVVVTPPVPKVEIGDCPLCDGKVVTRAKSFGCNSWKSMKDTGCGYVIWRSNQDGTEVSEDQAREMIARGETNARVEEVVADCPKCDGKVVARAKSFGCNSWKSKKEPGCGYVIWRSNQDGTEVTADEAREMAGRGETNARVVEVVMDCPKPRCKGKIVEREKFLGCNSWSPSKKGCGTRVWKVQQGRTVPLDDLKAQLVEMAATKKAS